MTEPAVEPVTLSEAKTHLRVDGSAFDTEVESMISAAREAVENYTNRPWASAQWMLLYRAIPPAGGLLYYGFPSVESIASMTYLDGNSVEQSLTVGEFTLDAERESIKGDWEAGLNLAITFIAGPDLSASPADYVPKAIKQAILLYLTDMFEHRAAQSSAQIYDNPAAVALMQPWRVEIGP